MSTVDAMGDGEPAIPDPQYNWRPGADPSTDKEIAGFFNSPEIEELKGFMCEIGRRMWQRHYVDGNGGNLSIRIGDNLVLCTPTLVSKGFMKPEDICLVDLDGRQLAGGRKSTSEILTHLAMMKVQPDAKACCHAHPPIATGFAAAGVVPERFLTPESEIFLGEIGLAEFRYPGSPECGEVVGGLSEDHTAIFMCNHGVITRGKHLEAAYWRMENIEAICQNYLVARQLTGGEEIPRISGEFARTLATSYTGMCERM